MNCVSPFAGVIEFVSETMLRLKSYRNLLWTDNCLRNVMSGSDVSILNWFFGACCAIILLAGVSNSTLKKNHLVDLPFDLGIWATCFALINPQVQGFLFLSISL